MNSKTIPTSSPARRIVRSAARIFLPALVAALAFSAHPSVASATPLSGIGQVVDLVKNAPTTPVTSAPDATMATTTLQAPTSGLPGAIGPADVGRGKVSDHRAVALAAGAEQLQVAMLASLRAGTATRSALNRSDIPPVDLRGAAASDAGVSPSADELEFGTAGAPVQPGRGTGLAGIGGSTVAAAANAGTLSKLRDVRSHGHHG